MATTSKYPELRHLRGEPAGKKIRFERFQKLYWGLGAGIVFAAFMAGLYFGILQANWHVFTLKLWWDNLFPYSWWPTYRHASFRDIPEPAFAVIGVSTVMAGKKYWDRPRLKSWRLFTTPLLLILLTFAVGIGGTWLLNYAFGHPVLQWQHIGQLALGFILGRFILRPLFMPVGATIQQKLLEYKADRQAAVHRVPFWVRFPLAPPDVRKLFSRLYAESRQEKGNVFGEGHPWLVLSMGLFFIAVAFLGFTGHFWVGTMHHTIGWLTPVTVK